MTTRTLSPITPRPIQGFADDRLSDPFRVFIAGTEMPVKVCPDIGADDCAKLSRYYQGMHHPNMRLAPRFMAYHTVHAELPALADVEVIVRTSEPVVAFGVHPQRKGIPAYAVGNELRFNLRENSPYVVVEVNNLPILCLIMERPEASAITPGMDGVVDFQTDYGQLAMAGDYTRAFAAAFQNLNSSGNTLFIPPGVYWTESLRLHHCRNFTIHIAEGALVNMLTSPAGENRRTPGVWLHECRQIEIQGRGCFDQRSYENFGGGRNDYAHAFRGDVHCQTLQPLSPDDPLLMSPLLITNSEQVTIKDATFRNGKVWNISVKNSRHLQFVRCKVITPPASNPEWTDGFNFGACRDVLIEDCFVCINDDCFAGAHYVKPYDQSGGGSFLVRGLVGYNPRAQGIRFGWACDQAQGCYRFENCDFIGKCEILVHPLRNASGDILDYERIEFADCGFDIFPDIGIDGPTIGHLEFNNVTFHHPLTRGHGIITGHPARPIGCLVWRNSRIIGAVPRDCLRVAHIATLDADQTFSESTIQNKELAHE